MFVARWSLQVLADGFAGFLGVSSSVRFGFGARAFRGRASLQVLVRSFRAFVPHLFVGDVSPAARKLLVAIASASSVTFVGFASAFVLQVLGRGFRACARRFAARRSCKYLWAQVLVSAAFSWRWLLAFCFVGLASEVGRESLQQASEQGAAPDRLQLRSFLTSLPAAGELVVLPKRAASWKRLVLVVLPFVLSSSSTMFRVGVLAARRLCSRAAFGFCVSGVSVLVRRLGFCGSSVAALVQVLAGATIAAQSV